MRKLRQVSQVLQAPAPHPWLMQPGPALAAFLPRPVRCFSLRARPQTAPFMAGLPLLPLLLLTAAGLQACSAARVQLPQLLVAPGGGAGGLGSDGPDCAPTQVRRLAQHLRNLALSLRPSVQLAPANTPGLPARARLSRCARAAAMRRRRRRCTSRSAATRARCTCPGRRRPPREPEQQQCSSALVWQRSPQQQQLRARVSLPHMCARRRPAVAARAAAARRCHTASCLATGQAAPPTPSATPSCSR